MANIKLISVILIILCVISLSGCCGGGGSGQTPSNQPPFANAGSSQTIHLLPGETTTTVSLNGSATDADGTIVSYLWSGTPAPAPVNTAISTVTLAAGTYTFTLVATDNLGAQSAASTVTVTVIPAPTKALITFSTVLPQGSTEKIGGTGFTIDLPDGVTLPIPDGSIPDTSGLLSLSGLGAPFAANGSPIVGKYTSSTNSTKGSVEINLVTMPQGIGQGEIATLVCDISPGTLVDVTVFPLYKVVIGNIFGSTLYDSIVSGSPQLASVVYTITLQ